MRRKVRGGRQPARKTDTRVPELPVAPPAPEPGPDHGRPLDEAGYAIVEGMRVLVRPHREGLPKRSIIVRGIAWTERHGWVVSGAELMTLNQVDAPAARCAVAETVGDMEDFRKRSRTVDAHRALLVAVDQKILRPTGKTRSELKLEE